MAIAPGFHFGDYEVIAPLGEGGMGQVYTARDLTLDRTVAVKILLPTAQSDGPSIRRFLQEAKAASALNHPNIVTIHRTGEAEFGHFIVMELIHGKTLRSLIGTPPVVPQFVHVAAQIAEGLSVAHASRIIHRDIKPENLMLRDDGYIKILDFGLARSASETIYFDKSTQSSAEAMAGTIPYMSPEQLRGERLSPATDVFSLGIVLYEFATGHHPFAPGNGLSVVSSILNQEPIPPSIINGNLPGSIDSLILWMMHKNAEERPTASFVKKILIEPQSQPSISVSANTRRQRFVGRKREGDQLHAVLEEAVRGRGAIVCLEGEAGLGKTTLAEHFLAEAASRHNCLTGRGASSERLAGTEAYLPVSEIIESLTRGPDSAPAKDLLRRVAPTWYLHVASSGDLGVTQAVLQAQAVSQERLRRECSTFLLELSRTRPVVLFLDDLHWADISTVDLLVHVASKINENRLLIVLAYRPVEMHLAQHPFLRVQHDLQTRGICQTIQLDFLSKNDLDRYLQLEFSSPGFPPAFLNMLHAKTEGNALFMVDVLRYLKEEKVVAQAEGRWVLSQTVPDIDRKLPESVRGMIQRNISMLGKSGHRLLMVASVEGYEFHASVIATVLKLDPADVEDELDQLDRLHGFIRVASEEELPDGTVTIRCRFVHVLYQSALLASLKPARRAVLSGAVARALEGHYKERCKEIASNLAVLFESAREFDRSARYFYEAALNARTVFAFEETVLLARRGLATLRSRERTAGMQRTEVLLHLTLGRALLPIKGFANEEARAAFDRAYALRDAIEPSLELLAVLSGLFEYHIAGLEIPIARQLAEQLIENGRKIGIPAFVVKGQENLGVSMFFAGEFRKAVDILEQTFEQYQAEDYRTSFRFYDVDIAVACLSLVGRSLTLLGYTDQGIAKGAQAVEMALSLSDPHSQCWAYQMLVGTLAQTRLERNDQAQAIESMITIATENGLTYWKAHGIGHKGWILCQQGNYDEGIPLLRQGRAAVRLSGTRPSILYFTGLLAEAMLRIGKAEEALEMLETELFDTERLGMSFPELARIRAHLLSVLTRDQEAQYWFQRSIAAARTQDARLYELRILSTWLRCCKNESLKEQLRTELATSLSSVTEGFLTMDVVNAREALRDYSVIGGSKRHFQT